MAKPKQAAVLEKFREAGRDGLDITDVGKLLRAWRMHASAADLKGVIESLIKIGRLRVFYKCDGSNRHTRYAAVA